MTERRVGVLLAGDKSYPAFAAFIEELALASAGFGFAIETIVRFAGGRHELLPSLAVEIANADPDVIVAIGAVSHFAVRATVGSSVPIVFAVVVDPFATGVVSRQRVLDVNVTGVTSYDPDQTAEQIMLLKRAIGTLDTIAIVGDADVPPFLAELAERAAAAQGMSSTIHLLRSRDEIGSTIARFRADGAQGVLGLEVPRINTHCIEIAEAATRAGLPSIFGHDMARAAPMLAYGTCLSDAARRAVFLALNILNGEAPVSLQIESVTTKELIVNLGTARRLNIDLPDEILTAAASVER